MILQLQMYRFQILLSALPSFYFVHPPCHLSNTPLLVFVVVVLLLPMKNMSEGTRSQFHVMVTSIQMKAGEGV